jgi:hypothetical protein
MKRVDLTKFPVCIDNSADLAKNLAPKSESGAVLHPSERMTKDGRAIA